MKFHQVQHLKQNWIEIFQKAVILLFGFPQHFKQKEHSISNISSGKTPKKRETACGIKHDIKDKQIRCWFKFLWWYGVFCLPQTGRVLDPWIISTLKLEVWPHLRFRDNVRGELKVYLPQNITLEHSGKTAFEPIPERRALEGGLSRFAN